MEITAKVITVLPVESGTSKSGNAWQKQSFVVETAGQYPKKICFQLFGDKVNDCPSVGEEVKVFFDIDSHEYNGRWFTQINAWKVEKMTAQQPVQAPAQQGWQAAYPQPQQQAQPAPQPQTSGDDLPF